MKLAGGDTCSTPYIHPHLVNIVYKFEWILPKTLGEIAIFRQGHDKSSCGLRLKTSIERKKINN